MKARARLQSEGVDRGEIGAGLIVVGSRGLGPLRRALMGSVSGSMLVVRG